MYQHPSPLVHLRLYERNGWYEMHQYIRIFFVVNENLVADESLEHGLAGL
jgi:hypothetical protein